MRCAFALAAALLLPAASFAANEPQMHDHHGMEKISPDDAPLRITINPEARVSVTRAGALPPPAPCGTPVEIAVSIVNQGFVTAQLHASWPGDPPSGATLEFHSDHLTGAAEELRILRITLTKSGPTDLSIAFGTRNNMPDLGGRDRVHFLMSCLAADE